MVVVVSSEQIPSESSCLTEGVDKDAESQRAASVTRNRCIKLRVTCRYENPTSLRTFITPEVNNVWKNSVFS